MHICQSLNLFKHSTTFSEREQDSDLAASRLQRGHRIQGHLALNEMQRWEVVRTLEFEIRKKLAINYISLLYILEQFNL